MDMLQDYLIIDGTDEVEDPFEYYAALQRQINSGVIWAMQGSCGRAAMDAIKSGRCLCGHMARADYYGTRVPARSEVRSGAIGSYDFVREQAGVEWADRMAAIDAVKEAA